MTLMIGADIIPFITFTSFVVVFCNEPVCPTTPHPAYSSRKSVKISANGLFCACSVRTISLAREYERGSFHTLERNAMFHGENSCPAIGSKPSSPAIANTWSQRPLSALKRECSCTFDGSFFSIASAAAEMTLSPINAESPMNNAWSAA